MFENLFVAVLLFGSMLAADYRRLKRMSRRQQVVYGLLTLPSVYFAMIFAFQTNWPSYTDLLRLLFLGPAQTIVNALGGPQ